jgi:hypothetical protein
MFENVKVELIQSLSQKDCNLPIFPNVPGRLGMAKEEVHRGDGRSFAMSHRFQSIPSLPIVFSTQDLDKLDMD